MGQCKAPSCIGNLDTARSTHTLVPHRSIELLTHLSFKVMKCSGIINIPSERTRSSRVEANCSVIVMSCGSSLILMRWLFVIETDDRLEPKSHASNNSALSL